MPQRNERVTATRRRPSDSPSSPERPPTQIVVVARHQTPDEQRRFRAATDALLTELVRRQLGREG